MTLADLLVLSGGWLEWPPEARPGGVVSAVAHADVPRGRHLFAPRP